MRPAPIADKIWEVSEGALTDEDTEIIWLAFGNPTRNTGRFRECFGRFRHRWDHGHIDSRDGRGHQQGAARPMGEAITARTAILSGSGCAACSRMRARRNSSRRSWSRPRRAPIAIPPVYSRRAADYGRRRRPLWRRLHRSFAFVAGRDARAFRRSSCAAPTRWRLAARIADEQHAGTGRCDLHRWRRCWRRGRRPLRQIGLPVTEVQFGAKSDRAPRRPGSRRSAMPTSAPRCGAACANGCAPARSTTIPN